MDMKDLELKSVTKTDVRFLYNQLKEREKIITIHEKEILDTGGGIKNIIPHINSNNLLVVNCDVIFQLDIFHFFHDKKPLKKNQYYND